MDALQGDIWVKAAGSRRRTRRALATILVAATFLGSALYWLATTGTISGVIEPPAGAVDGEIAEVVPLVSAVTRSVGAAQLQTGISLSRLDVAKDSTNKIRVTTVWVNPTEAHQVLNNPNAQIAIGIYRPVHTGACSTAETNAGAVKVTDTDSTQLCVHLDTGAGVKPPFDLGRLLLARTIHTGYLLPSVDGSATLPACTGITTSWCKPASVSNADQRALFVAAQILTPGGNPQGQQSNLNALKFFVEVRRSGA